MTRKPISIQREPSAHGSRTKLNQALRQVLLANDSQRDREIIAEVLGPGVTNALRDTRVNSHHDRQDIVQDVLVQMFDGGIRNDLQLGKWVRTNESDKRLMGRLYAQFFLRIRCRAIDLLRRQKIRFAIPVTSEMADRMEVGAGMLPRLDEVLEVIDNSPAFETKERVILKYVVWQQENLRKTARFFGISKRKMTMLMRRCRSVFHEEFGLSSDSRKSS